MTHKQIFLDYAMRFIGVPYKWGGENPISGMDCSGYVSECLMAVGLLKGRTTAQGIYESIRPISIQASNVEASIVFYGANTFQIQHVGILVCSDLMLEAGNGGSHTLTKEDADLSNAFVRIRPITVRSGFITALLPNALQ